MRLGLPLNSGWFASGLLVSSVAVLVLRYARQFSSMSPDNHVARTSRCCISPILRSFLTISFVDLSHPKQLWPVSQLLASWAELNSSDGSKVQHVCDLRLVYETERTSHCYDLQVPYTQYMMKVTRPIFPTPAKAFTTARLLLRPFTVEDVAEFHVLRTQPEVMITTSVGKVDEDHAATRAWMDRYLHPNDSKTFIFAAEQLHTPGVIVGSVGSHLDEPPTLGYMLRKEFWSYGYATEAVQGWLKEYWKLPRRELEMRDTMPEHAQLHWQGDAGREAIIGAWRRSRRHAGRSRLPLPTALRLCGGGSRR